MKYYVIIVICLAQGLSESQLLKYHAVSDKLYEETNFDLKEI